MRGNIMAGWIKLHRQLIQWEWFTDSHMVHIFIYLLANANFKANRYMGHDIPVGSLPTGRKKISADTKISEKTVRTCLRRLEKSGEIEVKRASKFSIVTLVNFSTYQSQENELGQQGAGQRATIGPALGQQVATLEEGKKEEKGKNEKNTILLWWNNEIAPLGHRKLKTISASRMKKVKARGLQDKTEEAKAMIADFGAFVKESNWFSFDWMVNSDKNFEKMLDGNYSMTDAERAGGANGARNNNGRDDTGTGEEEGPCPYEARVHHIDDYADTGEEPF